MMHALPLRRRYCRYLPFTSGGPRGIVDPVHSQEGMHVQAVRGLQGLYGQDCPTFLTVSRRRCLFMAAIIRSFEDVRTRITNS